MDWWNNPTEDRKNESRIKNFSKNGAKWQFERSQRRIPVSDQGNQPWDVTMLESARFVFYTKLHKRRTGLKPNAHEKPSSNVAHLV